MATFEQLFPTFLQKCAELHELLRIVAFMLFIVGTILLVVHGFNGKTLMLHLVRLFILTALLVLLPQWGNQTQQLLQTSILDGLGVDPSQVHEQYNHLLEVRRDAGNDRSWWDIIGDLNAFTVEILITGILWLVGQFASLLLFWAYIIQKFILFSAYALSPLLIGMMAIRPLRSVGSRYLMNIVGVLLWPLGWGVAALITQGILDFMTDPSSRFFDATASFYSLQATFGVVVVAFWIVFSTVAAPVVIQKVLNHGALAGGPLISGAFGSFLQTAATTAGAAAVAATTGLPLATVGASGLAAVLSTLSTAAGQGSAGAIIIAGSGLPPRSARGRPGDDITGELDAEHVLAGDAIQRHHREAEQERREHDATGDLRQFAHAPLLLCQTFAHGTVRNHPINAAAKPASVFRPVYPYQRSLLPLSGSLTHSIEACFRVPIQSRCQRSLLPPCQKCGQGRPLCDPRDQGRSHKLNASRRRARASNRR